jgi:membrane fusion protein (multidrug efflux system)
VRPDATTVPQRAVLEGPQGKFVYVVSDKSVAEARPVVLAEWAGNDWIVTEGLKPGDKVIIDGLMKLGPGAPVKIAEAKPQAAPEKPAAEKK